MELVLNPKQVNTLRHFSEEEAVEYGGILNSTYKSSINHSPTDDSSLNSVKKSIILHKFRYSPKIETILKVSIFASVLIGIFA